jgi:hypothetical protein
MLIIEERKQRSIVVGVPHHAPSGTASLPCPEHPVSDENAGYLGSFLARKLNCCSIIACNYTMDVNKCLQSDYSKQIALWKPKYLVEIHGHGGQKAPANVVEISSGSLSRNSLSLALASRLSTLVSKIDGLRNISVNGDFRRIYFKATDSATIMDTSRISFHIEFPPALRKEANSGKPSKEGFRFCTQLAKAVGELLPATL